MPDRIDMRMPDGGKSAITVETLSDGSIGLGFIREGQVAQAIKLPRRIARRLGEMIMAEAKPDA